MGLVPPERIPDYLGAMDIVVHASLREGLARVLPQALIAGKPVVSYDVDGAREVVLPGQTGFLVGPAPSMPLANAIDGFDCRSGDCCTQLGQEGGADSPTYSATNDDPRHSRVYERLLRINRCMRRDSLPHRASARVRHLSVFLQPTKLVLAVTGVRFRQRPR